ncbi:hypothetical protein GEV33_007374 [Tenebrio molitor]|uniref:Uncharacterized protein n=1 Tax=Tenebrio molitor TaxID=7067 RepID=A0A8J6HJF4_TENMO|nr:hypothetical protein GEV33_007374 [Tenebrio molitor]
MDSTVRPLQRAGGNIMPPDVGLSSDKASESPNPRPMRTTRMTAGSRPVRQQEPDVKKKSWVSRCSSSTQSAAHRVHAGSSSQSPGGSHTNTTKEPEDGELNPRIRSTPSPVIPSSPTASPDSSRYRRVKGRPSRHLDVTPGPLSPRVTIAATEGPTSAPRSQRLEPTAPQLVHRGDDRGPDNEQLCRCASRIVAQTPSRRSSARPAPASRDSEGLAEKSDPCSS